MMPGSDFEQLAFEADFEDDNEFDEEVDATERSMDEDSILFDENETDQPAPAARVFVVDPKRDQRLKQQPDDRG